MLTLTEGEIEALRDEVCGHTAREGHVGPPYIAQLVGCGVGQLTPNGGLFYSSSLPSSSPLPDS